MPHIHEKIDFTAEVFVVYKNTVLLRKKEEVGLDVKIADRVLNFNEIENYKELISLLRQRSA